MSYLTFVASDSRPGGCYSLKFEDDEPMDMAFPSNGFEDGNMSRLLPVLLETSWTTREMTEAAAKLATLVRNELLNLAYPEAPEEKCPKCGEEMTANICFNCVDATEFVR